MKNKFYFYENIPNIKRNYKLQHFSSFNGISARKKRNDNVF